ncbi:MAG: integrase core domain-containing protein [Chthoniobacteraceae bacterium]
MKQIPYCSPNLDACAERFVQSIKRECLSQFVVFGEHHLEYLIREYEDYYNSVRPHQGLKNRTIGIASIPPSDSGSLDPSEVECVSRLGGLLRHYHRKVA